MPAAVGVYENGPQALPELIPGDVDDEVLPLQPGMRRMPTVGVDPDAADIGEGAVPAVLEESGEDLAHGAAATAGEATKDRPVEIAITGVEGFAEGAHVAAEGLAVHAPVTIR